MILVAGSTGSLLQPKMTTVHEFAQRRAIGETGAQA